MQQTTPSQSRKNVRRTVLVWGIPVLLVILLLFADSAPSWLAIIVGAGGKLTPLCRLLSLFVAYVQRDGPGTTCWHTATASGCDQHLNPMPWLVPVVLLVLGAIFGQTHSGH